MSDIQFNISQLASWKQARDFVKILNARNFGGGVKPENTDPDLSGIFTLLWLPGPGGFPEPHYTDEQGVMYYPLLLRFNNGAGGMNVGLMLDKFKRFPASPDYVWSELTKEVNSMAVSD